MSDNPFNIVGNSVSPEQEQSASNEIVTGFDEADTLKRIEKIISASELVVFMKGNSFFPQCGFSMNTVSMFKQLNVPFKTYDILQDPELRAAIKEYSNWPTFPQAYLNGKLLGGNDILTEMFQSGDLAKTLENLKA